MWIGVVVAVLEDLAEERREQPAGEHRTLNRHRVDRRDVAERTPPDLVHDEDARRRERGVHGGDRDTGVTRPVRAQPGARLRLLLVVELRLDAVQELVGELASADAAGGFDPALEYPGRDGQDGAVTAHD